MNHRALYLYLFLFAFLCYPSLQNVNDDFEKIVDEIISICPGQTRGVSKDNMYEYGKNPDLFVPPNLYLNEEFEDKKGIHDVNIAVEYNNFKVWEKRSNGFSKENYIVSGARLVDSILQALPEPTGPRLKYHLATDEASATIKFYDNVFTSSLELYPAFLLLYVASDFCGSATTDDAEVDVQLVIASDKQTSPEPEVQVNKEMFLDMEKKACACRPLNSSACNCYKPDIVSSTSGFKEEGQYGKLAIGRFDASGQAWYSKVPEFQRMILDMYDSYDVLVTQIHQRLEAVSAAPFCCYNDTWYEYGQQIPIPDEPCKICICDADWKGIEQCVNKTCRYENATRKVDLISIPGECCGLPKEIIAQDFCKDNTACKPNGKCVSQKDDFNCTCFPGYMPAAGGKLCEDIDECAPARWRRAGKDVCPHGTCINTLGDYLCKCDSGFVHPPKNNKTCVDLNECTDPKTNTSMCRPPAGMCNSTSGSWICVCADGYQNPPGNNQTCVDVNECGTNSSLCANGTCINTPGNYTCQCNKGFEFADSSNKTCEDVNECDKNPPPCANGTCINTAGNFTCKCDKGFENPEGSNTSCVDSNECKSDPPPCKNGTCQNTEGGFVCHCDAGFQNPNGTNTSCVDVRECDRNPPPCKNGTCHEEVGGFNCSCDPGFESPKDSKQSCIDIDECKNTSRWLRKAEQSSLCTNGDCVNTLGSYKCDCNKGYKNNGSKVCVDINECEEGTDKCSPHGNCSNTIGSYTCNCTAGYSLDKFKYRGNATCSMSNICLLNLTLCVPNGFCNASSAAGGAGNEYHCDCKKGYNQTADKKDCVDINECAGNSNLCPNGTCNNTDGYYTCDCDKGFELVKTKKGPYCNITDKCQIDPSLCKPNGVCVSEGIDYKCVCNKGYKPTKDQKDCEDIDECGFYPNVTKTSTGTGLNTTTTTSKPSTTTTVITTTSGANKNYTKKCEHGTCVNTNGSYTCDCDKGFQLNVTSAGPICKLNDTCVAYPDICGPFGICYTTVAPDYICICPPGYNSTKDKKGCVDINECEVNNGGCGVNGTCKNLNGSFVCICDKYFELIKGTCVDLDMCRDPIARCSDKAVCIDGPKDIYVCQCPPGQTFNPANTTCYKEADVPPNVVRRTYVNKNDTETFETSNDTLYILKTNVPGCQMYLKVTFLFELSHYHLNHTEEACRNGTYVDRTPYISINDPYYGTETFMYCGGPQATRKISYFDEVRIRTANAGQNKLHFKFLVEAYKGPGACCGGYIIPESEDKNIFEQTKIKSSDYPKPYNNGEWCSWIIKRPVNVTSGGKIAVYIIDFSVVVTVPYSEESTLDCFKEDALFVSNTGTMEKASAMCGTFPSVAKLYEPEKTFIHWHTNAERVTRGFSIMYFFTNNSDGISNYERNLKTTCGLVKTQTRKREVEELKKETREIEEEVENNIIHEGDDQTDTKPVYVPPGLENNPVKPGRLIKKRRKRVTSAGGTNTFEGETPFLAIIEIINKKDKNQAPFRYFFGVLIAERFVVSSDQAKTYQEEDTSLRKIRLRFGVYDFNKRETDPNVVFLSAKKIYKHAGCQSTLNKVFPKSANKTNWEYTDSNLNGCPMLMVTGPLPFNKYIQPAMFPWFTFSWRSSLGGLDKFSKRVFHVGYRSDAAGLSVLKGEENIAVKISMQRTTESACLSKLNESTIAPQRFCTFATKGKGACMADLGGPILKRMFTDNPTEFPGIQRHWVVMGILVKSECGFNRKNDGDTTYNPYQAYIEVNSYLEWMQRVFVINKLVNCKRPMD